MVVVHGEHNMNSGERRNTIANRLDTSDFGKRDDATPDMEHP